jgi:hypothetical protein
VLLDASTCDGHDARVCPQAQSLAASEEEHMHAHHKAFEYVRADEVAECWDDVGPELYRKLWNVIVPLQKSIPNLEDSGPADHIGFENLAAHWHHLTEFEQARLNALAEERESGL